MQEAGAPIRRVLPVADAVCSPPRTGVSPPAWRPLLRGASPPLPVPCVVAVYLLAAHMQSSGTDADGLEPLARHRLARHRQPVCRAGSPYRAFRRAGP